MHWLEETPHLRAFWEALSPGAGLRCLTLFLLQHLVHSGTGYDARIRHAVKTVGVWVLMHDRMVQDNDNDEPTPPQQQQQCYSRDNSNNNNDTSTTTAVLETTSTERRGYWANPRHGENNNMDWVTTATRQFESLEHCIALKLIELSKAQRELELEQQQAKGRQRSSNHKNNNNNNLHQNSSTTTTTTKNAGGRLSSRDYMNGSSRDRFIRGLKIGGTAVAAGTLFAITGGLGA